MQDIFAIPRKIARAADMSDGRGLSRVERDRRYLGGAENGYEEICLERKR